MIRKSIALFLITALAVSTANAVPRGRPDPRFIEPDQIDPAQGVKVLEAFRSARTAGDYDFDFVLINRPRNAESHTYSGRMLGTWTADGRALTRTDIFLPEGDSVHLLYQGGTPGAVFKSTGSEAAKEITGVERFDPIVPGLTFTSFELQMPFLFWTDYVYEGTRKLMGRPAHYFLLYPPEGFESPEVGAVRVAIDADFLVMLMAEELDQEDNPIKDFRINGFKKVDGQWVVKEIDLVDKRNRDRTRFKVVDAKVGLQLPRSQFSILDNGELPGISETPKASNDKTE